MDQIPKETLSLLAYLYLEHFKYEKALNLLKALNLMYPEDIQLLRMLSFAYLKNGYYQEALTYSEKSLKKGIDEEEIMASNLIKGKALWALGKEEAARYTLSHLKDL